MSKPKPNEYKYVPGWTPPAGTMAEADKEKIDREAAKKEQVRLDESLARGRAANQQVEARLRENERQKENEERLKKKKLEEEKSRRLNKQRTEKEKRDRKIKQTRDEKKRKKLEIKEQKRYKRELKDKKIPRPTAKKKSKNNTWLYVLLLFIAIGVLGKKGETNQTSPTVVPQNEEGGNPGIPNRPELHPQNPGLGSPVRNYIDISDEDIYAIVDIEEGSLNLRSEPSLNSDVILRLSKFEIIKGLGYYLDQESINGESGSWAKVRISDVEGFVFSAYIQGFPRGSQFGKVVVSESNGLSLREEPDVNPNNLIKKIPNGALVHVIRIESKIEMIDGIESTWVYVDYKSFEGYVFGSYLEMVD